MKALVIYDSYFGNTEKTAQAIGAALGAKKDVTVAKVDQAKTKMLDGIDILIVGSPTRAFRPTSALIRFIRRIPPRGLDGVKVATFDTRLPINDETPRFLQFMVKFFGYANKPLLAMLMNKGGVETVAPAGFLVKDSEGPLLEGEMERAADWARQVKSA